MIKKRDSTKWKSEFRISKSNFPSCNLVIATLWQSVWWQNHFVPPYFLYSAFSPLMFLLQALCLYDYMKDYAGSSLFVLFKAIKFQVTIWQSDNLYLVSQKPTELTSLAPVGRTLSIACDPVATNNHLSIHQLDFPQSFCKSEFTGLSDL